MQNIDSMYDAVEFETDKEGFTDVIKLRNNSDS